MNGRKKKWKIIWALLVLFTGVVDQAKAQYIDPGTGSYLLQLLIAGFLAMIFYLKSTRIFFRTMFAKFFKKKDESAE